MKTSMSSSNSVIILFLWSFIIMASLGLGSCSAGCIETERNVLLEFKHNLTDPSNRLADWAGDGDCCRWTGVVCHNITGHITELHLRTLSKREYFGLGQYDSSYVELDAEYYEYHGKFAFGGKVSSSVLHLKYLRYLDLSNNDFGGISIPKFLGSMESLRYLNLSEAGFGGTIPPQLGNLSNLQYLNLRPSYMYAYNPTPIYDFIPMQVENLDWVSSLSSLEFLDLNFVNLNQSFDWLKVMNALPSLVELHLSGCQLPGFSPLLNPNFSSLSVLDLSNNHFLGPIPIVLQNMTSFLRNLDLSNNYFTSTIPNWLYGLSHLESLYLGSSPYLQGLNSSAIGNLTSLINLGLSYSGFEFEFSNSIQNLCNLRVLDLRGTEINQEINKVLEILSLGCVSDVLEAFLINHPHLSGGLGDHLGQFKNLRAFYVYGNGMIHGPIPRSLKHLCKLRSLILIGVKLNQEINEVLEILSGCISNGLQSLALMSGTLSGHLEDNLISYMKNLAYLDLSGNSISGPIPFSLREMTSLRVLDLSSNKLNGTLPAFLGQMTALNKVDISNNAFEGEVSENHFTNLTKLQDFRASVMGKNISFRVSSNWIPPFHQLFIILLGSLHIGPQFPVWLRSLRHLQYLDLSNSGISSSVPIWFWDLSSQYRFLNFSCNQMHGLIPNLPSLDNGRSVIDLSSNNFNGQIPYFSSNLTGLDLSNNLFSGSIFNFLCYNMLEGKSMQVLNLAGNNLFGEIPDCWMSWQNLRYIQLRNNNFSGNMPNSVGNLIFLKSLHLRANSLSGVIPLSLASCISLRTLDLSENKLVGNIPPWIGERFSSLAILNFRANKFEGHIPKELCRLPSLRILDLAENTFSRTIPSCFSNFTAMAAAPATRDLGGDFLTMFSGFDPSFLDSALVMIKGRMAEYSTTLGLVKIIDLSHSNLSGEIPMEITNLAGLQSLNLSQNTLTGKIPNNIGAMRWLEALDFSQNQLIGEIPEGISNLTFLSKLNLSYNKLSGRIPSGTQIQGFEPSSFIGNQLCGLPLTKNCSIEGSDPPGIDSGRREEENGAEVDWFYVSMALGFVVGFWSVLGSLIFIRRWRYFYCRFLNNLGEKIWWSFLYKFF